MLIKNKNVLKSFILTLAIASLFVGIAKASAATFSFVPSSGSYTTSDTIRVKVSVSSSTSINAVSATVSFPKDILELTSISKAGSIVNLWAQEPSYSNSAGTAKFEGVILSGYNGNSGTVITLVFKAKIAGTATLQFSSPSILANDGNGTEIFSGKSVSNLTIVKSTAPVPKVTTPFKETTNDTVIKIEELKNNLNSTQKKFLITPPSQVKDDTYNIAIDYMDVISWVDDGTHIYQSPVLTRGTHFIKISADSVGGDHLSGFVEFSTSVVTTPIITDYPTNLLVNEFLVLKGVADPLADIAVIITDMKSGENVVNHTQANNTGKFSFVSDEKMSLGTYSVSAKAITKDGLESESSNTLQIVVKQNVFNNLMSKIGNYLTIIIPIIALTLLILFLIIYGMYHLKRVRNILKRKLSRTEDIVSKSFGLLEEDVAQEIAIFRKIRSNKPLNETERSFLNRLKRDIESAEKIVLKEVKNLEKGK